MSENESDGYEYLEAMAAVVEALVSAKEASCVDADIANRICSRIAADIDEYLDHIPDVDDEKLGLKEGESE